MAESTLAAIARTFAPLSLASVGGGLSVLAAMQHQTVEVQHWLTPSGFLDLFAIARAAPGPNSLIVALIGWKVAGLPGAVVAAFAMFAPSSLVVYLVARLWRRHRGAHWQEVLGRALVPIATGLVLAGAWSVLRIAEGGPLAWATAATVTAALFWTRVNPLWLLAGGGLLFGLVGVGG